MAQDESRFDLIDDDNTSTNQQKWKLARPYVVYMAAIVFEFIVIVSLITSIVVRGEHLTQQLTLGNTTTESPLSSKVSDVRGIVEPINSICFPCREIGDNVTDIDIGSIIRLDKKTNMCCMDETGNLKKLFFLIINEYYRNAVYGLTPNGQDTRDREKASKGPVAGHNGGSARKSEAASTTETLTFWKEREDAAHMFLDNKSLRSPNKTVHRIPWDGTDYHNLSMANHLVVYHPSKRSIQVTDSGLYFIYSSITFQAPPTDLDAQVYHTLLREHYLLPNTGATMLMINKYGGGTGSTGFYTSFLCGSFRLRVGDEIFVTVSNSSFVYNSYYSNYLGLYRF